ncbi:hypothetical protein CB0940_10204 [Cercospora beticola]|nr:hypothetical protein CB0940_10204 [Cercospora beticola]PIA96327.1 hypothetical protein CB0940_10204 [Cercospora beticola]
MSDQTSTITAYDSRTTESRTITTSVAATTTFYGTTVTTTSTVTEPTSTAYVYTSTATTASTSTVTVTPTVTTTMTTQAPDATSVISQCLAPGLKQQDKRDLVEDHGLIKRQSPSSSVPIPNCFLRSYSTTLGDGRSTVTTSTAGKSEQSATTVTKTLSPTSTTYSLIGAAASPTFYIANIDVTRGQVPSGVPVFDYDWHWLTQDYNKQVAGGNVLKFVPGRHTPPSGTERFIFYVNPSGTSLTGTLYNLLGNKVAGENPIEYTYPNGTKYRYYEVALFNAQAPATLSIPTVACRYSGARFSLCPMRCWWTGDGNETTSNSVSQGSINGPWYLAKPGQVSQSTYPLYAIN